MKSVLFLCYFWLTCFSKKCVILSFNFTTIIYILMTQTSGSRQQQIRCQQPSEFLSSLSFFSQCCVAENDGTKPCWRKKVQMNTSGLAKKKSLNSIEFKRKLPQNKYKKIQQQLTKKSSNNKLSIRYFKSQDTTEKHTKSMNNLLLIDRQKQKKLNSYITAKKNKRKSKKASKTALLINKTPQQIEMKQKHFIKSTHKPYASSSFFQPVRLYDQQLTPNHNLSPIHALTPMINKKPYILANNYRYPQQLNPYPQRRTYQQRSPFYSPTLSQPISPMKIPILQKNYFVESNRGNYNSRIDVNSIRKAQKDENQSSEKTQKKYSFQDENLGVYRDLKNISIANSSQLQNSDKNALNDFIKQKLKQSDLKQTKKDSHNLNSEKNTNQKQTNEQFLKKMAFPLIESEEIQLKKAQKEEKQKSIQANFKKISKPISPFFPETAIAKSKIGNRMLNPEFYDKDKFYKQPIGYGISSNYNNLNPGLNRKNMTGLSSLTVNSYLQSIQQSKIVQKVQQSMVLLDFFNPNPGRKLTDTNYENFQSRQL